MTFSFRARYVDPLGGNRDELLGFWTHARRGESRLLTEADIAANELYLREFDPVC